MFALPTRLRASLPIVAAIALFSAAGVMAFGGTDPDEAGTSDIRGGDLVSFWTGGTLLREGNPRQFYSTQRARQLILKIYPARPLTYPQGYPPPISQIMALPQGAISYLSAAKALLLGMAALHILAARLVIDAFPALRPRRPEALALAIALPAAFAVSITGQLGGLWTLSFAGAFALRGRGRPAGAGLALSVLFLKPTLAAPALLAFVLQGEGALVGGMIAGGALILALSLAAGGLPAWGAWIDRMRAPAQVASAFIDHWGREQTLRNLFTRLAEDKATGRLLGWVGMGLGTALAVGLAVLARRARGLADPLVDALGFAAVFSATLIASLHGMDYDLGLLLPALAAAGAWGVAGRARWPRVGVATTALAWLCGGLAGLNSWVGFNVTTLAPLAWVLWLGAELRAASHPNTAASATQRPE